MSVVILSHRRYPCYIQYIYIYIYIYIYSNTNACRHCCFRYYRFINSWLRSMVTWGETQFYKVYANHTMLTPPQRAAHLVMSKISVGSNPKKTQLHLSTVKIQLLFSKSSNSQNHLFQAWRNPHSSLTSCLGVYYDKWWLSYPLRTSVTAPNGYAPVLRDSNSSKSYQIEW